MGKVQKEAPTVLLADAEHFARSKPHAAPADRCECATFVFGRGKIRCAVARASEKSLSNASPTGPPLVVISPADGVRFVTKWKFAGEV